MKERTEFLAAFAQEKAALCECWLFKEDIFKSPVLQNRQKGGRDFILLAYIFKHLKEMRCMLPLIE